MMLHLYIVYFFSLCMLTDTMLDMVKGQEKRLPEYVVSECYGDIFSFDCGAGNKIRINRDFFGVSPESDTCHYSQGDCIISNPKSNSLIHRFCTGRRGCTYYLVERRGCNGYYSNYQQVEYQCVPDSSIVNICSNVQYEATSTYIASPNFPDNYPPNLACSCAVTATTPGTRVRLEIVYLAIKYNSPCQDWLRIGRKRTCGTSTDLFTGTRIPIEFHSNEDESHSGFWLHFQASRPGEKLKVQCGNSSTVANLVRNGGAKIGARPSQDITKPRPSNPNRRMPFLRQSPQSILNPTPVVESRHRFNQSQPVLKTGEPRKPGGQRAHILTHVDHIDVSNNKEKSSNERLDRPLNREAIVNRNRYQLRYPRPINHERNNVLDTDRNEEPIKRRGDGQENTTPVNNNKLLNVFSGHDSLYEKEKISTNSNEEAHSPKSKELSKDVPLPKQLNPQPGNQRSIYPGPRTIVPTEKVPDMAPKTQIPNLDTEAPFTVTYKPLFQQPDRRHQTPTIATQTVNKEVLDEYEENYGEGTETKHWPNLIDVSQSNGQELDKTHVSNGPIRGNYQTSTEVLYHERAKDMPDTGTFTKNKDSRESVGIPVTLDNDGSLGDLNSRQKETNQYTHEQLADILPEISQEPEEYEGTHIRRPSVNEYVDPDAVHSLHNKEIPSTNVAEISTDGTFPLSPRFSVITTDRPITNIHTETMFSEEAGLTPSQSFYPESGETPHSEITQTIGQQSDITEKSNQKEYGKVDSHGIDLFPMNTLISDIYTGYEKASTTSDIHVYDKEGQNFFTKAENQDSIEESIPSYYQMEGFPREDGVKETTSYNENEKGGGYEYDTDTDLQLYEDPRSDESKQSVPELSVDISDQLQSITNMFGGTEQKELNDDMLESLLELLLNRQRVSGNQETTEADVEVNYLDYVEPVAVKGSTERDNAEAKERDGEGKDRVINITSNFSFEDFNLTNITDTSVVLQGNMSVFLNDTIEAVTEETDIGSTTAATEFRGKNDLLTLGIVILCVCIGVGLLCVIITTTAMYIRRRKQERIMRHQAAKRLTLITKVGADDPPLPTMRNPPLSLPSSSNGTGSDQDSASGRGLLLMPANKNRRIILPTSCTSYATVSSMEDTYQKGKGHQSFMEIDSPYTKMRMLDKGLQVDLVHDEYEDMHLAHDHVVLRSKHVCDSDSSMYFTPRPGVSYNHKAIQVRPSMIDLKSAAEPEQTKPKTNIKRRKAVRKPQHHGSSGSEHGRPKPKTKDTQQDEHQLKRPASSRPERPPKLDRSTKPKPERPPKPEKRPSVPPKPKFLGVFSDSEMEIMSGGEEVKEVKKMSMASMPGLSEMIFMPESCDHIAQGSDSTHSLDSDWETRSAISI